MTGGSSCVSRRIAIGSSEAPTCSWREAPSRIAGGRYGAVPIPSSACSCRARRTINGDTDRPAVGTIGNRPLAAEEEDDDDAGRALLLPGRPLPPVNCTPADGLPDKEEELLLAPDIMYVTLALPLYALIKDTASKYQSRVCAQYVLVVRCSPIPILIRCMMASSSHV